MPCPTAVGKKASKRPLPSRGQRNQPLVMALEPVERHVRKLVDRAVQMRRGNQLAQVDYRK
jgi:hypothetical protein